MNITLKLNPYLNKLLTNEVNILNINININRKDNINKYSLIFLFNAFMV